MGGQGVPTPQLPPVLWPCTRSPGSYRRERLFADFLRVAGGPETPKSAKERFRVKSANNQVWNNQVWELPNIFQESPRQTKPKKGPKRKVHEFRPFLWILEFFLRKTSTVHIELLFWNAPAKSSWTDLTLVWFAGATPEFWRLPKFYPSLDTVVWCCLSSS